MSGHPTTPSQKFWKHVIPGKVDACWEWTGRISKSGYGLSSDPNYQRAHRLSWFIHFGPIPDSLCVLHKCDNRKCVNPAHLFLGTHLDNKKDCISKGRHARGVSLSTALKARTRDRGEGINTSKLTENDVLYIRQNYRRGRGFYDTGNSKELAERFGVTTATIRNVALNRNWRHV